MAAPLIIDSHMHIYPTREEGVKQKEFYDGWEFGDISATPTYTHYDGNMNDALDSMKNAGVSRAVVVNLYPPVYERWGKIDALPRDLTEDQRKRAVDDILSSTAEGLKQSNIWTCGMSKDHPELIPFIFIDPLIQGAEGARDHLRDMVENHGAKGIKLHTPLQRFYMADERMWPVYEASVELGIAIVAHSGASKGNDQYGDPSAFAEVYRRFPDLKLVTAHMGNASWDQTLELAETFPNAVFDCCEIMTWSGAGPNAPNPEQLGRLIKDVGPERVMMGTDFPWWDHKQGIEDVMRIPGLSTEEKEGILGANATRILGI